MRQNPGEMLYVVDLSKWFLFSLGRLYSVARAVAKEAAILLLSVTEPSDLQADQGLSRERLHPYSI
jgi:hypothetical protein